MSLSTLDPPNQFRRSVTLPASLNGPKANNTTPSAIDASAETLFAHPRAKIVRFAAAPPGAKVQDESLPWSKPNETTVAAGVLRIYSVPGSTAFLHSGDILLVLMSRTQCWCVDGVSKFAIKLQSFIYRVELPYDTEQDQRCVEDFKRVLGKILFYERTACPFKRTFQVEVKEQAVSPLPVKRLVRSSSKARKWAYDDGWRPEGQEKPLKRQPERMVNLRRTNAGRGSSSSPPSEDEMLSEQNSDETLSTRPTSTSVTELEPYVNSRVRILENKRSVTAPLKYSMIEEDPFAATVDREATPGPSVNQASGLNVETAGERDAKADNEKDDDDHHHDTRFPTVKQSPPSLDSDRNANITSRPQTSSHYYTTPDITQIEDGEDLTGSVKSDVFSAFEYRPLEAIAERSTVAQTHSERRQQSPPRSQEQSETSHTALVQADRVKSYCNTDEINSPRRSAPSPTLSPVSGTVSNGSNGREDLHSVLEGVGSASSTPPEEAFTSPSSPSTQHQVTLQNNSSVTSSIQTFRTAQSSIATSSNTSPTILQSPTIQQDITSATSHLPKETSHFTSTSPKESRTVSFELPKTATLSRSHTPPRTPSVPLVPDTGPSYTEPVSAPETPPSSPPTVRARPSQTLRTFRAQRASTPTKNSTATARGLPPKLPAYIQDDSLPITRYTNNKNLVNSALSLLMGPPSGLVQVMMQIAARVANSGLFTESAAQIARSLGDIGEIGEGEVFFRKGERWVPGGWDTDSEGGSENGEVAVDLGVELDDVDDYGVPLGVDSPARRGREKWGRPGK